jgi:hypothetical protein
MITASDPCQQGRLLTGPRSSRSTRCGQLHSEAIAMLHPRYQLDLHHDRARSLQRAAHERRLRAEAARQPSNQAHLSLWREVLGMRLARAGLQIAGSGEMPRARPRRLPQPRLAGQATPGESTLAPPPPIT